MFSAFGLFWVRGEWKCSVCSYQRRWYEWNGAQHPRSPMEKWNGDLSAATEYHGESWCVEHRYGELVWRSGVETWQSPWSPLESACGNLAASMESHGLRSVDTGHSHGVP